MTSTPESRVVPVEPTEEMWGGLARDLVMWSRFPNPTGAALYKHLGYGRREVPAWLLAEIPNEDRVPPKGTVAVAIFKAMIAKAPAAPAPETVQGWRDISSAPNDGTLLQLWAEHGHAKGSWRTDGNFPDEDPQWFDDTWDDWSTGYGSTPLKPTHWMPLPPPPAAEEGR